MMAIKSVRLLRHILSPLLLTAMLLLTGGCNSSPSPQITWLNADISFEEIVPWQTWPWQTEIRNIDWPEENTIIVSRRSPPGTPALFVELLDVQSGIVTSHVHEDDILSECDWVAYNYFRRLPDGRHGYGIRCEETGKRPYYLLYAWDWRSGQAEMLFRYPRIQLPSEIEKKEGVTLDEADALAQLRNVHINTFALNPEMTEIVQESGGANPDCQLFHASRETGVVAPLFADAFRVCVPSWSSDGKLIAFAGNNVGPTPRRNIFSGLPGLRSVIFMPWNLYVVSDDFSDPRIVLRDVTFLRGVRWHPQSSDILAFTGQIQGVEGLWVFNLLQNELWFVWATNKEAHRGISYDWSPDGKRIVLVDWYPVAKGVMPSEGRILLVDLP